MIRWARCGIDKGHIPIRVLILLLTLNLLTLSCPMCLADANMPPASVVRAAQKLKTLLVWTFLWALNQCMALYLETTDR